MDVFSSGVVLFALISGRYPFEWAHISDLRYRLIIDKNYDDFWAIFDKYSNFSESSRDLIQNMLAYDP